MASLRIEVSVIVISFHTKGENIFESFVDGQTNMAESAPLQKEKSYTRQKSVGPTKVSSTKKYTTFTLNVLFWLSGLLMVLVGVYSKAMKYDSLLKSLPWFLDPANFILGVGVVLTVIPFLGCIGSLRENIILLKVKIFYAIYE